jgi:hypothetical protein
MPFGINQARASRGQTLFVVLDRSDRRETLIPTTLAEAAKASGCQAKHKKPRLSFRHEAREGRIVNVKPFRGTLRVTNPVRQSRAGSRRRVLRGDGQPSLRRTTGRIDLHVGRMRRSIGRLHSVAGCVAATCGRDWGLWGVP